MHRHGHALTALPAAVLNSEKEKEKEREDGLPHFYALPLAQHAAAVPPSPMERRHWLTAHLQSRSIVSGCQMLCFFFAHQPASPQTPQSL
jgi:hypothetical protein